MHSSRIHTACSLCTGGSLSKGCGLCQVESLSRNSLSVGLLSFLYPYCQRRVLGSRSLLVVYFTPTKSPRGPPWNEGHRPKDRHETSVFEVPAQEWHEHSFTLVLLIRLLHVLCTWYAGIAHHRALQTCGQGWADSKAVHGMECSGGTLALLEIPLSRGCCL